jgi:hypothetical protein
MESKPLRDFAIALSLANLCFLRDWQQFVYANRFTVPAYTMIDVAALASSVLLVAGVFFLCLRLGTRTFSRHSLEFLRALPFAVMVLPLNQLRQTTSYFDGILPVIGKGPLIFILAGGITCLVWTFVRGGGRLRRVLETAALVLLPFVFFTFSQAVWIAAHRPPAPALAQKFPAQASGRRVLWIIFDEMDERIAFDQRPDNVALPHFDRLRSEAFFASNAFPPASETILSMPSLLTGRVVVRETIPDGSSLLLGFAGERRLQSFAKVTIFFDRARGLGFNTALVGYALPYCRLVPQALTYCAVQPYDIATKSFRDFGRALVIHLGTLGLWSTRKGMIRDYSVLLADAKRIAADPSFGAVLIHLPVPHLPAIYDRNRRVLSAFNLRSDGYLDNLALADRALGEIRDAMERAGTWDSTTVLVSSDHSWRGSMAFDGKSDARVPFILKLGGAARAGTTAAKFNTVISERLLLASLQGQIPDAASIWASPAKKKMSRRRAQPGGAQAETPGVAQGETQ